MKVPILLQHHQLGMLDFCYSNRQNTGRVLICTFITSEIGHLFISLMSFIFSFFVSSLYPLPSFFSIIGLSISVF